MGEFQRWRDKQTFFTSFKEMAKYFSNNDFECIEKFSLGVSKLEKYCRVLVSLFTVMQRDYLFCFLLFSFKIFRLVQALQSQPIILLAKTSVSKNISFVHIREAYYYFNLFKIVQKH